MRSHRSCGHRRNEMLGSVGLWWSAVFTRARVPGASPPSRGSENEYRSDIISPPSTTSMDDGDGVLLCCRLSIYTHIYDRNEHFGGNDNENESTIGNKR